VTTVQDKVNIFFLNFVSRSSPCTVHTHTQNTYINTLKKIRFPHTLYLHVCVSDVFHRVCFLLTYIISIELPVLVMQTMCVYYPAATEFLGTVCVHFWFPSVEVLSVKQMERAAENVGAHEGTGDSSMIIV
jgi:hypothetical protein